MEYKEIVLNAVQALRNNLLRTSLTMLGIIIGISAVILIYSIGQGAVAFVTNELSSFGTDYFQITPGSNQFSSLAGASLTLDDVEAIQNDQSISNIKHVIPMAVVSVQVSSNGEEEEVLAYGSTPESSEILRPDIIEGEYMTEEQNAAAERIIVIGTDVRESLFGEDSTAVGETVRINNRPFRVIGVIESSSVLAGSFINNSVVIPLNIAINQLIGREQIQEIDVVVEDSNATNQTIEDVEALLRDRHGLDEDDDSDFQISSAQDILGTVQTITGLLTSMIVAISGISLVVGGVGVMNIMLVSVTERTKEIGLLKAIGAKEKDILTQFLVEAMVMTLIGGSIGILIGIVCAYLVSIVANIPFIVSIPAIIIAAGISTLVGVAFGLYPARKAAKLTPIDALRYE